MARIYWVAKAFRVGRERASERACIRVLTREKLLPSMRRRGGGRVGGGGGGGIPLSFLK